MHLPVTITLPNRIKYAALSLHAIPENLLGEIREVIMHAKNEKALREEYAASKLLKAFD